MRSETLRIRTGASETVHDLTGECAAFVRAEADGLLSVFARTPRRLAILETGAGSDDDLLAALGELLPARQALAASARQPGTRPRPRAARLDRAVATIPVIGGGWRSAPGSRCAWSTPTSTNRCARCG